MNEPLLSVIVPVYNVEKYIEECLNSIINSTYKNFEVIVINDGTKDKSAEIAKKFAEKDSRIKVFDFENAGLSEARNRGVKLANGKYISFVDSDDFIDKKMYADLIEKMQRYDLDIIECGCIEGDENHWEKKFSFPEEKIYAKQSIVNEVFDLYYDDRYGYLWMVAWNAVYKREIVTKVAFPVGMIYEDTYASGMFLGLAKKLMTVKECYYFYRRNFSGITKSGSGIKRPLDVCLIIGKLISDLQKIKISNKKLNQRMALELYYFCRAKNPYYRVKKMDRSLYEYIMENLPSCRKKIHFFITCHRKNLL